jgi:hypothetical protein
MTHQKHMAKPSKIMLNDSPPSITYNLVVGYQKMDLWELSDSERIVTLGPLRMIHQRYTTRPLKITIHNSPPHNTCDSVRGHKKSIYGSHQTVRGWWLLAP